MHRAPTALVNRARPDQKRGATDIERSEDDIASRKKLKRSRGSVSLSDIFKQGSSPPPPQPEATPSPRRRDRASQPSPIANSPLEEAAASGSARSSSSSADLSDLFVGTSSLYQDPGPGPAAPEPEPEPEPQTSASPIPAEDVPLPPVDNAVAGPGAFTDDVDSLPSDPILGSVTGDTGDQMEIGAGGRGFLASSSQLQLVKCAMNDIHGDAQ
ncbi:hypothetical protein AX14_004877, partial [Amanita brunnescens Koide BX004]